MILVKTAVLATVLAAAASTTVVAAPTRGFLAPAGAAPAQTTLTQAKYHRRSYGTGYHGRGTRTGGPAGGLPSRN